MFNDLTPVYKKLASSKKLTDTEHLLFLNECLTWLSMNDIITPMQRRKLGVKLSRKQSKMIPEGEWKPLREIH